MYIRATSLLALYIRNTLQHGAGAKRRAGGWSSDPMIEADVPNTEVLQVQIGMMCASHRGGHGLTIDDATQRFKGAKRRPRLGGCLRKARAREKPGPCVEGELKGARLDD